MDYVTDGPISAPLYIPGCKADVDLGGLKFSYQHGIFYTPSTGNMTTLPIKLPPPFEEGR